MPVVSRLIRRSFALEAESMSSRTRLALMFCLAMLPALVLWATRRDTLQSSMSFRLPLRRGMAAVTAGMALLFWT